MLYAETPVSFIFILFYLVFIFAEAQCGTKFHPPTVAVDTFKP